MTKPDQPDEKKEVPPLYISTDEEIPEEGKKGEGKLAFGEIVIWILFGLGVLLAVYISYYGLKPAPPRSDLVSKDPGSRKVLNKIVEKEWAAPAGTLHFRLLLTPALAEIKYDLRTSSPMEIRFLSLEVRSERGYAEILQDDGLWETVEPGRISTRQYTLAGSSTRSALLTIEARDGEKVIKVGIPFD